MTQLRNVTHINVPLVLLTPPVYYLVHQDVQNVQQIRPVKFPLNFIILMNLTYHNHVTLNVDNVLVPPTQNALLQQMDTT
jgi:hypothetical protein